MKESEVFIDDKLMNNIKLEKFISYENVDVENYSDFLYSNWEIIKNLVLSKSNCFSLYRNVKEYFSKIEKAIDVIYQKTRCNASKNDYKNFTLLYKKHSDFIDHFNEEISTLKKRESFNTNIEMILFKVETFVNTSIILFLRKQDVSNKYILKFIEKQSENILETINSNKMFYYYYMISNDNIKNIVYLDSKTNKLMKFMNSNRTINNFLVIISAILLFFAFVGTLFLMIVTNYYQVLFSIIQFIFSHFITLVIIIFLVIMISRYVKNNKKN